LNAQCIKSNRGKGRKNMNQEQQSKIYLDASLISDPSKIDNMKEEELEALGTLSENLRLKFYTSEKTKREIAKHENVKKKNYLSVVYSVIEKVPEENIIESVPAAFNMIMFNEAPFGGSADREDPLFTGLKKIFDEDDAEHIFQAEKHNLDYFLTLDERTILNRIREKQNQLKILNLKIHIVSPTQIVTELKLK
jgi:predicted nucleic acid-binding protein